MKRPHTGALLVLLLQGACGDLGEDDFVPENGTLHEHLTLEWGATARTYHLYQSDLDGLRPVVVLLHGGGATIDAFIGATGGAAPLAGVWLELADEHGIHLLIPQGLASRSGPHWNDCRGDCTVCGEHDDAGFVTALLDELSTRASVDDERVFASGESNGGFMALRLAQEHPDRFAAVTTTIGLMPGDNDCVDASAPISVSFLAGTDDEAVPFDGGDGSASGTNLSAADSAAFWLDVNQCNAGPEHEDIPNRPAVDESTATRTTWSCNTTQTTVELITIDGGGHATPSIREPVSLVWEAIVGRQNHDVETAEEQWAFFREATVTARSVSRSAQRVDTDAGHQLRE